MLPRLEKAEESRAVIDLICMVPHLYIATNRLTAKSHGSAQVYSRN